ncbi:MAG: hypothetical protein KJO32_10395 [Deltaproteobacteria bacterium]|nr:hypothetical protein [Deltaproteobacteria bacterium]
MIMVFYAELVRFARRCSDDELSVKGSLSKKLPDVVSPEKDQHLLMEKPKLPRASNDPQPVIAVEF